MNRRGFIFVCRRETQLTFHRKSYYFSSKKRAALLTQPRSLRDKQTEWRH